jgi:hypothetical protein
VGLGRANFETLKLVGIRDLDGLNITLAQLPGGRGAVTTARVKARVILDSTSMWSRIDIFNGTRLVAREFKKKDQESL